MAIVRAGRPLVTKSKDAVQMTNSSGTTWKLARQNGQQVEEIRRHFTRLWKNSQANDHRDSK